MEAIIVVRELERREHYFTIRGYRGGEMVEFGNVNAYVNHKTFLPERIGCCDNPQAFTLIDLIEISALMKPATSSL